MSNPYVRPLESFGHRLHTLGPRRVRHRSPLSSYHTDRPSATYSRRVRPEVAIRTARASRAPAAQRPSHPFQLGDTLARINRTNQPAPDYGAMPGFGRPSLLDAVGASESRSAESGSTGSSRTLRAEDESEEYVRPRRRIRLGGRRAAVEDDSDE